MQELTVEEIEQIAGGVVWLPNPDIFVIQYVPGVGVVCGSGPIPAPSPEGI